MKKHPNSNLYVTKDGVVFKEARISSYGHQKGCLYVLSQFIDTVGYPTVTDYDSDTQQSINWHVHQLIMETYMDKIPGKPYIDHIDRNKLNSCLANLRYVSQSENNLNRDVSDKALAKWGFRPCEDIKRYKREWAKRKRREQNACRVASITASTKAA